jgi:DNA-binding SARP family transcriptional activator
VLKLHTFGRVYLVDESGQPVAAAAGQRRTLALLSALAVAGDAGLSREKIIGLLWPDSDEDRARHSLTQTLYLARRALRCDDVFEGGADLRLNRHSITSDVQEFEAALSKSDWGHALDCYQGPFLDGFFLPGSNDFEQWATLQRNRFENRVVAALDQMAALAHDAGDQRRRVELLKRAAALKPLDSGATVRLMSALAAVGDRAGALQHARVHEALLRDELELDPDPAVTRLVAELREKAPDLIVTSPVAQASIDEANESTVILAEPLDAADGVRLTTHTQRQSHQLVPLPGRVHPRRRAVAAVSAIIALLFFAIVISRIRNEREVTALPVRQQVLVAPFRIAGATASLGYLREGLVELLSARLADDSSARSVDAGAVLGAWRRAGLTGAVDVPRDTVVRLATRMGAERVVIGSVVGTPARTILNASVIALPAGTIEGTATVEGPTDSITSMVDQLAARLLTSQAGEDIRIAERTTSSLPALRAYLEGQSAYRRASYGSALRYYERALELDSTFALAALRLSIVAERLNDIEPQRRALARAWRFRQQLTGREYAHLVALAGPRFPGPSTAAEQLGAWEHVVSLAPDRAEAWYELGARLFRDGPILGLNDSRERAAQAFQRALVLDPTLYLARNFLIQLAVLPGSGLELAELASSAMASDSIGPLSPFLQWRVAVASQDTVRLRALQDTMLQLGPLNLRTIALSSQFDAVALQDGARAVDIMARRAPRAHERIDAELAVHSLATLQGRPSAAFESTARFPAIDPRTRVHLRLRVLDRLYAEADSAMASEAYRRLEELNTMGSLSNPNVDATDVCILAQWRLSHGDTARIRNDIALLRQADLFEPTTYLDASPAVCADLLSAWLGTKTVGRRALVEIRRLDSLALGAAAAGDASTYAHVLIARLYRELRESRLALQAIRRRPYMAGWPRYLATAWREEAALAEATGDIAGAIEAYERYLDLRADPEPRLQQEVEEIRRRYDKLESARTASLESAAIEP